MRGSDHARGIKAWAMNSEPKALGQKRSGPAGASTERLPADRRVQSGRWAWGRGTLPSRKFLAGGTSRMKKKVLQSLYRSATRRVWAGDPAWIAGAEGILAGHRPEKSRFGHGEQLGGNTYRPRLHMVPPVGTERQLLQAAAGGCEQYQSGICQRMEKSRNNWVLD